MEILRLKISNQF